MAFSCCLYEGGRAEKSEMDMIRQKSWKGKFKRRDRVIRPDLNRVNGKCPLTPLEVNSLNYIHISIKFRCIFFSFLLSFVFQLLFSRHRRSVCCSVVWDLITTLRYIWPREESTNLRNIWLLSKKCFPVSTRKSLLQLQRSLPHLRF